MHLPTPLLMVTILTASASVSAGYECHPPGTLSNTETGTSSAVIDSLNGHSQMDNCITTNDQNQTTELAIKFTQQFIDELPAQPQSRNCNCEHWDMPQSIDQEPFTDARICSFKGEMECAKGYRVFGDFQAQYDSPVNMTMVLWRPLGLFKWNRVHNRPQIGFYFYFNVGYHDIVDIPPGWSSDNTHVVEAFNHIIQRPALPADAIPINYVPLGYDGARAGTGGFMMRFKDDFHKNDLLWGYYGGKQAFISATFLEEAFGEIATQCTLNGIKPNGETAGSGHAPTALMPCTTGLWCNEISWPTRFSTGGSYPTEYCIEYQQTATYQYTVSVRNFRTGAQILESEPEETTPTVNSATPLSQPVTSLALLSLILTLRMTIF